MNYRCNPPFTELLTGQIDAAIIFRQGGYVAWTKEWEGPLRPDLPAAKADLKDRLDAEVLDLNCQLEGIFNEHAIRK